MPEPSYCRIASFKLGRNLWQMAALNLFSWIMLLLFYVISNGKIIASLLEHPLMLPFGLFGILGSLGGIFLSSYVILKLLFGARDAIWIENGKIVYLHRFFFSISLNNVGSIRIGYQQSKFPFAIFMMKNGVEKSIPLRPLVEEPSLVLSRLQELV